MNWYYETEPGGELVAARLPDTILENGIRTPSQPLVDRQEWTRLALAGWYREYREETIPYQDGWLDPVVAPHPVDGYPVAYVATGPKLPASDIRRSKLSEIRVQVSQPSSQDLSRDPRIEEDLMREWAAASDKTIELQETTDQDVEAFDPTLDVRPPQEEGTEYSRFSLSIAYVDEWAGAPGNNVGFVSELVMITDDPTQGDEARLVVKEAPSDVGAVLPFVQDTVDPTLWICEARDGHKWVDTEQPVSAQLLWGVGSLPISPILRCERIYDRQATPVRYGVAGSASARAR